MGDASVDSLGTIELICEAYGRANLAVAGRHVFFFLLRNRTYFLGGFFFVWC